jgi:hypothetical protein
MSIASFSYPRPPLARFVSSASFAALASLAFVACGDDDGAPPPPPADMGPTDAGMTDLGPGTDMGGRDMGAADPCAAETPAQALANFACNGAPMAPPGANALFGACTEGDEDTPEGSCTDADVCWGDPESPSTPFCVTVCAMDPELYIASSDCPRGSRCLNVGGPEGFEGFCVPSCARDADCASGYCDLSDGTCYFAEPAPADGGMPDAGMADAGMPDAGMADAGMTDAATADDAGMGDDAAGG